MQIDSVLEDARAIHDWVVSLRRQLHRRPELQYEEVQTSRLVQQTLQELAIPFQAGIAETGVVATIGGGSGPCVALRADMDALPIHEEADVEFRSEIDGKMHACGHDCHTAMLLGAARLLKQHEAELPGTVKLIFQPAEEGGAGGERMREAGVLKNPDVQRIFGLHVWPLVDSGCVTSRSGTFLAASGALEIVVRGRGGHAAMPHLTIDPVTTAAKVITELQTLVSREVDPLESAVISITAVHGGEAYNVIPMEVKLRGTIRALTLEHLEQLQGRVGELVTLVAQANRCEAKVEFPGNHYPPTVNDEHCWELASRLSSQMLGRQKVVESPPIMGGEDFAYFTQAVPGCFVGVGIRNAAVGATYGVHHPQFKVDENALPIGTALHVAFAVESLRELG